ncbi:MAG: DNA polymerase/3'-5' exonuclease PolX [Bacillaceae bacterium]|nr:DNA polymerase/3'-5' exonuclease PolX [Bacillaceae bacterium]
MKNRTVARMLLEIAQYLEIEGANAFKVNAFRRASQIVEEMGEPVEDRLAELESIPGIGKGTAAVIREIVETGESVVLKELKEKIPDSLLPLLKIPGLGPKSIGRLYRELDISSVKELEQAIKQQKIRSLPGFGAKTEQKIREGIRQLNHKPERFPIALMLPVAEEIEDQLRKCRHIRRFSRAGSLRRFRETAKDLDFIVATDHPEQVADDLVHLPQVRNVINKGATKVSVEMDYQWPVAVDFRLVRDDEFASALHHFTGSKEHNVQMRQRAKRRGYKISEYGVENVETGELTTFETEYEFFRFFDLPLIPPEIREGKGEIERAETPGGLPQFIELSDIRGDLHMHSTWSDGGNTIRDMAEACRHRGYEYMAITDHSRSLRIAGGLSEEQLLAQKAEIDELNKEWDDFKILAGVEMDILSDGRLDFDDGVLKEMDVVIGSVHTAFKQNEDVLTKRVIGAIENNHVDFIAHPTGRLIGRRGPYALNVDAMLRAAKETDTAIELNANPNRLDLHAEHLRKAREEYGVRITVNTDAHSIPELDNMKVGIGTARRGWLTADDVINTMTLDELMRYLKRHD